MNCAMHPERIAEAYTWKTRVQTVDVGPDRLLTPTAQLRMQQEVGELHFGEGGLGFEGIASLGMAFLVLQNACVVIRRPMAGEEISVTTWSHSVKGAKFYRCYRFTDATGAVLIDSMAAFALVDVNTHRLLRPSEFPFTIAHAPDREHGCTELPRIKPSTDAPSIGQHTVTFSQLDFNGHLNNTRYADVVFDHLPPESLKSLRGFSVVFAKEAKLGDVLTIRKEAVSEDECRITAQNGDAVCFTAQVYL